MPVVVGVSFKPVTKIYYFDPGPWQDLQAGEYVIVETSRGREVGQVVWPPREVPDEAIADRLKPVVRRATAWDMIERDQYQHREAEALALCKAKAAEHGLPMKVISAEYNHDGGRLVVSFTAEGRVDFRELVRDLAQVFHTRIEMKQIGVRDEAKIMDGIGKCGRRLCCASWLREFNPVTIKMAKQQSLPLSPGEISGVCGRLLCCLAYEVEVYKEARKELPKIGSVVQTPEGPGKVRKVHPLREVITVRLEDGALREFPVRELRESRPRCNGCALVASQATVRAEASRAPCAVEKKNEQAAERGERKGQARSRGRPRRRRRKRRGR